MKVCGIENCERPVRAHGWCSLHYKRWERTGDPDDAGARNVWGVSRFSVVIACFVDGCERESLYALWGQRICHRHYHSWRRTGGIGEALTRIRMGDSCLSRDCTDKGRQRGYCPKHYEQIRVYGSLGKKEAIASPLKAIMEERGVTRQRAHQILNRDKHRSRQILWSAVKRGEVIRPSRCERCKKKVERIEAHHEDYAKPLDVAWLCPPCHSIVHPHLRQVAYVFKAES